MKLSHYISILVLSCMSIGLFSSGYLYFQTHGIEEKQLQLNLLKRDQAACENLRPSLENWLTTIDLYLVNKQTYLYKGIEEESKKILKSIKKVELNLNSSLKAEMEVFRENLNKVSSIIAHCQNISFDGNLEEWDKALNNVDVITQGINLPVEEVLNFYELSVAQKNIEINSKQELLQISGYLIISFIGLFTLIILHWARVVIVEPLEKLTQITEKKNVSTEDFRVKGPKEVNKLSEKFCRYILDLMKARELALAESQLSKYANARMRNIMETAGDAIVCVDNSGNIIEMNQSFRNMAEINMNKSPYPNFSVFLPELDLSSVNQPDMCTLICVDETQFKTKKNNVIPVETSVSCFMSKKNTYFTVIIRDISDRKKLLEKLVNAQKLESIGRLAAGIAHEINTPAQYIMDYNRFINDGFEYISEYIKKAHKINNEELEEYAEKHDLSFYEEEFPNAIKGSLFGLEQISKIVKSVKGFSHPQQQNKVMHNINNLIESTVNVSRNEWKYNTEIVLELDENLPDINCFPVRLNQVFLNLIVNAAQSITEKLSGQPENDSVKGVITISTVFDLDKIYIKISDTGAGIKDSIRNKIFDPFFTTKEVGVGTGQGLALAYDFIVNKHKGKIDFDSELGVGTTFEIVLPVKEYSNIAKAV